MPKIKTKKTLQKRVKVTKGGKILKKQTHMGHLKSKKSANTKLRKKKSLAQENKGHIEIFKKLLGKHGKDITNAKS